jgi:hypothetical protein
MPTFRTSRPASLRDSISTLLGGSSRLSPADLKAVDEYSAGQDQKNALAEKTRLEIEQMREGQRLRSDPGASADYASVSSGLTTPIGRQLAGYIRGESIPPLTPNDDEGNVMPAAAYARPDAVTPEQERGFRSNLASTMVQNLATGKTNAEQLTQSGGNLLTQALRSEISATPDPQEQNTLKAAISPNYREPYSGGAPHGVAVNQETGEGVVVDQALRDAAVKGQTGGKPPSGYTWGPTNEQGQPTLVRIPGGPADATPHPGSEDAIEMAAHRYVLDGTLPPNLGRGAQGSATTMSILTRAAAIAKENGQDGEAARIGQLANKASQMALGQLSKQETMVGAFERNFTKNADLALEQSKKVDRTGVPALNRWVLAGKKSLAGDPDVAVLDTAIKATVNEYTKIISGAMGNASMAEGEIRKVEGLLNSAQTPEQVQAVITFMKKETGNRMAGFAEQKAHLMQGMRSPRSAAPAAAPASAGGWSIRRLP